MKTSKLICCISIYLFSSINVKSQGFEFHFVEQFNNRSKEKIIATSIPEENKHIIEVGYNSHICIYSYKDGIKNPIQPKYAFQEINIEIINDKGKSILIKKINKSEFKNYTEYVNFNPSLLLKAKSPNEPKYSTLINSNIVITVVTVSKEISKYYMKIRNYKTSVLFDLKNPDLNTFSIANIAETGLLETTIKTQVSLAYLMVDDKESAYTVFHVPVIRFDYRNWILKNFEIGFSIPVNTLEGSLEITGFGGSIGFLKTKNDRTCFQIGYGKYNQSLNDIYFTDKDFFYVGFDIPSTIRFVYEALK